MALITQLVYRSSLLLGLLLLAFCPPLLAAEQPAGTAQPKAPPPAMPTPIDAGSVMQLLLGLAAVVVMILLLAWLMRRFGGLAVQQGAIKVVAGLSLGSREKVVLVQVGDRKQVLLGVAPGRVSTLAEFDEPVVDAAAGGQFSERLRDAVRGRQA
ncbi:flagellar biosynthetic protein FliO [Marinobacterium arenosum]|uniref:flagellar biosynthetic protein FliO n=1 Tax=Marinobacterium arenosum TaxID=2862496 RepID=UPI001C93AE25|nr:flagellar biosynthetic protein FliO [Marinobacterium arenosum]MBY4675954.1 flagellar biosynthetic protein FliO [Marinobacterium arenosum]